MEEKDYSGRRYSELSESYQDALKKRDWNEVERLDKALKRFQDEAFEEFYQKNPEEKPPELPDSFFNALLGRGDEQERKKNYDE